MSWLVWLLCLGCVGVLATVECLYQTALTRVPARPPRPEGVALPPLYVRLRSVSLGDAAPPRVEVVWPGSVVRVLVAITLLEWRPSEAMPEGFGLADGVARQWSFHLRQEHGQPLRGPERLALAIWLTRHWSGEELLIHEAEHAFLIQGLVGLRAGAEVLFGRDWARLDVSGMALLIAVSEAPGGKRDPWCFPEFLRARRDRLLKQLRDAGGLSPAEAEAALQAPLGLVERPAHWAACE